MDSTVVVSPKPVSFMNGRPRAPHPRGVLARLESAPSSAVGEPVPGLRPAILLFPQIARGARLGARWCTPERVADLLDLLLEDGARFVDARGALPGRSAPNPVPARTVVLGFEVADDAFASWMWPVLDSLGIPITLFVDTAAVGQRQKRGPFGRQDSLRLSWSELSSLHASGVNLASRGHHDVDHAGLAEEVAFGDLVRSRREMERRLGLLPEGIAYPRSRVTDSLREVAARVGFEWGIVRGRPRGVEDRLRLSALSVSRWDRLTTVRDRLWRHHGANAGVDYREAEAS